MKRILISGANSYIGTSFETYLTENFAQEYYVDTVDVTNDLWQSMSFAGYDAVFHVAGIAHIKETRENAHLYYEVNRDLAQAVACKAKAAGVGRFIFMSTMSVYGKVDGAIDAQTEPRPVNHYGKSKLEAETILRQMETPAFSVVILRPPMVYGNGCPGNYAALSAWAKKLAVFPAVSNKRSMLYIGNLCAFVRGKIDGAGSGVYCPQNGEYVCTSAMVDQIAKQSNHPMILSKALCPFVRIALLLQIPIAKKVFGSLIYTSFGDAVTEYGFNESIALSEGAPDTALNKGSKNAEIPL